MKYILLILVIFASCSPSKYIATDKKPSYQYKRFYVYPGDTLIITNKRGKILPPRVMRRILRIDQLKKFGDNVAFTPGDLRRI